MTNHVTIEEQTEMGIRNLPTNYVAALPAVRPAIRGEIMPPSQPLAALPETGISQIVRVDQTYEGRGKFILGKVSQVTLAIALATGAAMIVLSAGNFFWWMFIASVEWCAIFAVISWQDWSETPASQQHKALDTALRMMEREQKTRLKAHYGEVIE